MSTAPRFIYALLQFRIYTDFNDKSFPTLQGNKGSNNVMLALAFITQERMENELVTFRTSAALKWPSKMRGVIKKPPIKNEIGLK